MKNSDLLREFEIIDKRVWTKAEVLGYCQGLIGINEAANMAISALRAARTALRAALYNAAIHAPGWEQGASQCLRQYRKEKA